MKKTIQESLFICASNFILRCFKHLQLFSLSLRLLLLQKTKLLPLLLGVYVKGPLNNRGPLQTPDDERVGPGAFCLHQLALYEVPTHWLTLKVLMTRT